VTTAYLARSLRRQHAAASGAHLAGPLALEVAGIVDGAALRSAWSGYVEHGGGMLGVTLLFTLHAELWLRAHV
jgi:hypothetical protein